MCSPVALMAAGAGMQAGSTFSQASSQQNQLNYQAQVADANAKVADDQRRLEIIQGQTDEQTQRLKAAQVFSDQRAAMAANGIDLGEGSATDTLGTTKFMGERDALTVRDNALRRAWGYQVQSDNYKTQGAAARASASSINPLMAGATSLLGSATDVAGTWYKAKQVGVDLNKSIFR